MFSESGIMYEIVAAIDINPTANKIYKHNFPKSRLLESGIEEFLLTPLQFGIPNARLRYYLIAKRKPLIFSFQTSSEV
ncbi:hypothetical protein KUTeg_023784 [Tegillarca granosa]|uniref:DNA (cytosine-5-)-methyltransferase n=1 Tax=Tegillarca granosa TaxID=220873 RepID=A0ABQ9E323_TEGGR|nr:hypothetical protein KUTeg_023784 [Tegillarca granosa]